MRRRSHGALKKRIHIADNCSHHHIQVPEGVYIVARDKPVFKKAPKITDEDVEKLLKEISANLLRSYLKKRA